MREQLVIVDACRSTIFDDDLAVDDDGFHVGAAAVFDESIDRIAHRTVTGRAQIDDHRISFRSNRKPTQVLSTEGIGAADGRSIENSRRTGARGFPVDESRDQGGVTHLRNDIERIGVGP